MAGKGKVGEIFIVESERVCTLRRFERIACVYHVLNLEVWFVVNSRVC